MGWIQCWPAAGEAEEVAPWAEHGVDDPAATAGIDYLVGEPGHRGRGVGSEMIRVFVDEVVFGRHPDWSYAAAAPYEDGPCRLMVATRPGAAPPSA